MWGATRVESRSKTMEFLFLLKEKEETRHAEFFEMSQTENLYTLRRTRGFFVRNNWEIYWQHVSTRISFYSMLQPLWFNYVQIQIGKGNRNSIKIFLPLKNKYFRIRFVFVRVNHAFYFFFIFLWFSYKKIGLILIERNIGML